MKDYLIGVISWSSLLMTRRWSRVLLGTLALRHFLCSWLASPFSPTRIAETFIYMTDSAALAFLYSELSLTLDPKISDVGGNITLLQVIYIFSFLFNES
jgi:hypothetical protein